MKLLLLNGEAQKIGVDHRSLSFGDGIFETCYVNAGRIEFLPEHLERLMQGCEQLGLQFTRQDVISLKKQLLNCVQNIATPHVLKFMLLRNAKGRGYDFDPKFQSVDTVIQLIPYQLPSWSNYGASVYAGGDTVFENERLKGVKHLNRLDSVMARQSARQNGAHEAIMRDQHGFYIEGSMSNLFVECSGQWVTPKLERSGVAGVVRDKILSRHPSIVEKNVTLNDLNGCRSAFICNSLLGIVNVLDLNSRALVQSKFVTKLKEELFDRD